MSSIRPPPFSIAINTSKPNLAFKRLLREWPLQKGPLCVQALYAPHVRFTIFTYGICACQHRTTTAPAISPAKTLSNSISCSNGACVRRGRCRMPY